MHNEIRIGSVETDRLGTIWLAFSARGLVCVEFSVSRRGFEATVKKLIQEAHIIEDGGSEPLAGALRQMADYACGERRRFEIAIDWSSIRSEFNRRSLQAVVRIPYGQTRTYGQVAAQIGAPGAARAMGRANATNPMPLVIPCHRVLGSDGKLHGYGGAGGLKTKRWLLDMEHARLDT